MDYKEGTVIENESVAKMSCKVIYEREKLIKFFLLIKNN